MPFDTAGNQVVIVHKYNVLYSLVSVFPTAVYLLTRGTGPSAKACLFNPFSIILHSVY